MDWNRRYPRDCPPTMADISAYIGDPLWGALTGRLAADYGVAPKVEHSTCSGAPGWNVKYKKSGRAPCTLYPDEGFFTCLVSVGGREATEAELLLPACTEAVRKLYWAAKPFNGSRWLMIPVTSPDILADVERLIALRVQKK